MGDNGTTTPAPRNDRSALMLRTPEQGAALSPYASEANFVSAMRMATQLSRSTMVPEAYRAKYDQDGNDTGQGSSNCMIALEMAGRIGCSVLMVMQNLHVVHGNPGWGSPFLVGTVNTSGRFTPIRYEMQGAEGTDDRGCRVVATELASGDVLEGTLVTIAMAKAYGWYSRKDSHWPRMPEQMLKYRAAALWVRAYAPELALGMQTAEEVRDTPPERVEFTATPVAPTRASLDEKLSKLGGEGVIPIPTAAPPPKPASKPAAKVEVPHDPQTGEVLEPKTSEKAAATPSAVSATSTPPGGSEEGGAPSNARDFDHEANHLRAVIANAKALVEQKAAWDKLQAFGADESIPEGKRMELVRFWNATHPGYR